LVGESHHRPQLLCPPCPTLECTLCRASKDNFTDAPAMDNQFQFPDRPSLSSTLLHRLLAQQHQSPEHFCSGLQIPSNETSLCATHHDGLSPWMGE